jgi:hypothetical protein
MSLDPNILNLLDKDTKQYKVCELAAQGMSNADIAEKLGITKSYVRSAQTKAKHYAAKRGYAPEHDMSHPTADGFVVKGVSTLYGDDGQVKQQWVKTNIDLESQIETFREAIQNVVQDYVQVADVIHEPKNSIDLDTDVIPWFNIGDGHLGMLAFDHEVGHNFDLKIARSELIEALSVLIDRAPACERCVIQDMGDMTHYQDFSAQTESGHILDFDTRYPKMIETYHYVMRSIIEKALTKFKYVDVIINQGNHSRSNDIAMVHTLKWVYQDNPRLHVLDNSSVFIPYRMGNTFVMSHHSDKCKPNRLADVMSTDFAKDWGESFYRYIDIGHIHHRQVSKENSGVTIESWNQLAPSDKYAHDGGWRSRSCLTCVLRSKTYGETGRITLTAEEVKDRIMNLEAGTTVQKRRYVYTV